MADCSCEFFVAGKKLMAHLEECDNVDGLIFNGKSDGLSFDSSDGIVLDTPQNLSF